MTQGNYPKHRAAVAWLEQHLGQGEVPPGSNTGPFVRLCQAASWLAGTGWAWCRACTLKAHQAAGFTLPDRSPGAWDALARAQKRGDALPPTVAALARLIPGDEVIWAEGSGHSSTYTGHSTIGGQIWIQSIDGNVQDKVERCSRPLSAVKGFIVWREEPLLAPVKVQLKPPLLTRVGGISGHQHLVTRAGFTIQLPKKKPGLHGVVAKKAGSSHAHTGARGPSGPRVIPSGHDEAA